MVWFRRKARERPSGLPMRDAVEPGLSTGPDGPDEAGEPGAGEGRGSVPAGSGAAAGRPPSADPTWPHLGSRDAEAVRQLVRRAFGHLGLDVEVEGSTAVDPSGRHFDIDPIGRACRLEGRGRAVWSEVVDLRVTALVDALDLSPFDGRDGAALLASTYSRVVAADSVSTGGMDYARTVAPGLVEVLNLDLPESVAFFGDDAVVQHGPIGDLWRAGRVNLRGVEAEERQTLEREGGRVQVLFSDSMFLASTVLQIDEVVTRETGSAPDPDLGVLVSLPHRHQLAFHVIADDTLLPSLALLAKFGAVGHTDGLGPISPDVYWWHHGRLDRLTTIEGERIQVDADVEFTRVVEQVTGERGA